MKKAFTLVELFIVIAIIAILAVAILPSVIYSPGRGRDAARFSDLKNISSAIEAYFSDNKKYPLADDGGTCVQDLNGQNGKIDLRPYFENKKIHVDAMAKGVPQVNCTEPPAHSYIYCAFNGAGGNYALVMEVEEKGNANVDKAFFNNISGCDGKIDYKGDPYPAPGADAPWFYILIK